MPVIKEVTKGGNITYYINEAKGTVAALIRTDRDEAYNVAETIVHKNAMSDISNSPFGIHVFSSCDKCLMSRSYVGVAKCSPQDKFDTEVGKKIALARAQKKFHTALQDRLMGMAVYFCGISKLIEERACYELEQARKYEENHVAV